MIKEPVVVFTPWTAWAARANVKNAHLPGVYLLATWEGRPPAQVDPLAQKIVFIGEALDGSLLGRWQQFDRAAFQGKPGHRGGIAYHEIIGGDGAQLYVASFAPEGLNRDQRPLFINYLSARLLWDFTKRWDTEPLCNGNNF